MKPIGITGWLLLLGACAFANDGRDRYHPERPVLLQLFPDPPAPQAGYRVLEKDMPGGADGDRAFRWARPHAIALVRLAAYETHKVLGAARYPMAIFDLSAENGDTPIQFEPGKPPRGRHPGGSHDGGVNLDLGYYLTSEEDERHAPDYAACSAHFDNTESGVKDAYRCKGNPDKLDVSRQAFFLLELLKINQQLFDRDLIEEIGMDRRIKKAVMNALRAWESKKKHDVNRSLLRDAKYLITADRWEGWAGSHHHHMHLRLRNVSMYGRYRRAVEKLYDRERCMDKKLLGNGGPIVRARLLSSGLRRAVEMELLSRYRGMDCKPDTRKPDDVRFRVGSGRWVDNDPAYVGGWRAVIDLEPDPETSQTKLQVEAELTFQDGPPFVVRGSLEAPRRDRWLAVSVDPANMHGKLRREEGRWTVGLEMPDVYSNLVTDVTYRVERSFHRGPEAETLPARYPGYEVIIDTGARTEPIDLIQAVVTLSSRMKVRIPLYCRGP